MDKLEVKHLAPYLPYDLMTDKGKLVSIQNVCRSLQVPILKFEVVSDKYEVTEQIIKYPDIDPLKYWYEADSISEVKPILRPISSIVSGNKYIILYRSKELLNLTNGDLFIIDEGLSYFEGEFKLDISKLKYEIVEKLFKYHFDVFGLIDKGLAIKYIEPLKEA